MAQDFSERKSLAKDIGNLLGLDKGQASLLDRQKGGGLSRQQFESDMQHAMSMFREYARQTQGKPSQLMKRLIENDRKMGDAQKRKKRLELENQLERCMKLYNTYLGYEPGKNDFYRKVFCDEGGVIDCMKRYHRLVENELVFAQSLSSMKYILWGSNLQYLSYALKQLERADERKETMFDSIAEYRKYLKASAVRLEPSRLEEILNTCNKNIKAEEKKRKNRKKYEAVRKRLESDEMKVYFKQLKLEDSELETAEEECAMRTYLKIAQKVDSIFHEILIELEYES
ncbi:MAG: hypothetical protein Q4E89_08195 [Eubacteriales bacterium]|nr:hypothetical protein [Eubacteriales bacterium]